MKTSPDRLRNDLSARYEDELYYNVIVLDHFRSRMIIGATSGYSFD